MATTSRTTPTRKPATPKPKAEPKPTFHFSIRQAEAEREEEQAENPVEPFCVEALDGSPIFFKDPSAMGWQEASTLTMRDPHLAIRSMLEDEYVDKFYDQGDFSTTTLRKMMQGWMDHHGVTLPGN